MTWRNLREELCDVLAETIEARIPLAKHHPNQSVHIIRRSTKPAKALAERVYCRECRKLFERSKFNTRATFCTRACQARNGRRRRDAPFVREIRAARIAARRCRCGKPVRQPKRASGRLTNFCGALCSRRARYEAFRAKRPAPPPVEPRICACGVTMPPPKRSNGAPRQYCSKACQRRQHKHLHRCVECIFRGATACTRRVPAPKRKPWTDATEWRPGRLRLTAEQRAEARRMREAGAVLAAVAARFGIAESHAHRVTQGIRPPRETVVEFRGERRSLKEWAAIRGISREAIRQRLNSGWSVDRALTEPWSMRRRRVF
jgi:hypothetical protein